MADIYMDLEDSDISDMSSLGEAWVVQFCANPRNQYFCEVKEQFMEEDFNLTGLMQIVPHYKEALELILDLEHERPVELADISAINESGVLLYGLIHARYIMSKMGIMAMAQKYNCNDFGTCPRVLCEDFGLLPMGRHDMPGYETVRLFCPCCRDIYMPPSERFSGIDGAFFGSSFPAMMLQMLPEIEARAAQIRKRQFHMRIYGFKLSTLSKVGPRMTWLRQTPDSIDYRLEEEEQDGEEMPSDIM